MKKTVSLILILVTFFSSYCLGSVNSEVRIFSVLQDLPRFAAQDLEEPDSARNTRLNKLSISVSKAAKKHRPRGFSERDMQSALITIAYKETRLAKNVGIGRCDLMPKGQRCDSGRAKTYFQLWDVACPAVWEEGIQPGSQEELDIAATCAARLFTSAYYRCAGKNDFGDVAGGFSGYRSTDCNWKPKHKHQSPESRANFMNSVSWKLSNVNEKPMASNENKDDVSG